MPYFARAGTHHTACMALLYRHLNQWILKTTSSFAPLLALSGDADRPVAADGRVYRLRQWPTLPACWRTARMYRALSVMSHRPVNRHWLVASQGLKPAQADALISYLVTENVVDVVDSTAFPPARQAQAVA